MYNLNGKSERTQPLTLWRGSGGCVSDSKQRSFRRLLPFAIPVAMFAGGYATSSYVDREGIKAAREDKTDARDIWQGDKAILRKDIEICRRIYKARDDILGRVGLAPEDDDPLDLGPAKDNDPLGLNRKKEALDSRGN